VTRRRGAPRLLLVRGRAAAQVSARAPRYARTRSTAAGTRSAPRHERPATSLPRLLPTLARADPRRAAAAWHALHVQHRLARALERPDAVGPARPHSGRSTSPRRHLRRREIVMYGGRGAAGLEIYWDGALPCRSGGDSVFLDPARISLAPLERIDVIVLPARSRLSRHAPPALHGDHVAGWGRHRRSEDGELPRRVSPSLALGIRPLAGGRLQQTTTASRGPRSTAFNSVDLWSRPSTYRAPGSGPRTKP